MGNRKWEIENRKLKIVDVKFGNKNLEVGMDFI